MCAEKTPTTVNTRRKVLQEKAEKTDKQPTITESMGVAKGSQGGGDRDSESLKDLIKQMDTKWSNNWAQLTKKIDNNNDKISTIEKKFDTMFEQLSTKISDIKGEMQNDLKQVKEKVKDVEDSMTFHVNLFDDLKKDQKKEFDELIERQKHEFKGLVQEHQSVTKKVEEKIASETAELKKKIRELEIKNLRLEKHDRKYSLLLYGIPKESDENVYDVVRNHFTQKMAIDKDLVNKFVIQNAHRVPHFGEKDKPQPIIVKFACFKDKEVVLEHRKQLPKGMRVLNDLPVVMKKERGQLESEAYHLRNPTDSGDEKLRTRVKEVDLTLILETRKNSGDTWIPYKIVKFDTI